MSTIEGQLGTYLSNDEAIPTGRETSETRIMEYLNTITFFSFPPHELQLKVGSPIMLLRNVNLLGEGYATPYHQTLENKISLKFGKITSFDILAGKESEFSEHHFEFIAYNQLASRVRYRDEKSKMIYPILIGCIRSIGDATPFGNANTRHKYQRKVDIENLNGNIVEFIMWGELAKNFNKEDIEKLTPQSSLL
ncbi:DNA helicase [Tanacetum coccineum]